MARRKATPLPMERVEENIAILPQRLRRVAIEQLNKDMPLRHGSETFARKVARAGEMAEKQLPVDKIARMLKAEIEDVKFWIAHPEIAVSDDDRETMTRMVDEGASFRAVEVIWHLKPCNGNDVYRCVETAREKNPKLAKPKAKPKRRFALA